MGGRLRSVIIYLSPGRLTLMLPAHISEFKLVRTAMCWLSTEREPALLRFVFALNVSELTLNRKLETSHQTEKC